MISGSVDVFFCFCSSVNIYTEEKAADPAKEDTGMFFFKGDPGERFAVCNAGGVFALVGAMQDSFLHAEELGVNMYFDGEVSTEAVKEIAISTIISSDEVTGIIKDCLR